MNDDKPSFDEFDEPSSAGQQGSIPFLVFDRQTVMIGLASLILGIGGLFLLFKPSQPGGGMGMGQPGMIAANAPAGMGQNVAAPGMGQGMAQGMAQWGGGSLSATEREHLLYMREEEKLALDVYRALYQKWQLSVFGSISRSEERHTTVVASLMPRYGVADPVANAGAGQFTNAHLASLYQQLMQKGSVSTLEALRVGALIEEVDIQDLDTAMAGTTKPDIQQVYQNIQRGSFHHLRAFVHAIELFGQGYQAQVLPQDRVNSIVNSPLVEGIVGTTLP
jgi:hypothetical protein